MVSTDVPDTQEHATGSVHGTATVPDRSPIVPTPAEHTALVRIAHELKADKSRAVTITIGDKPALGLPPSLLRVLRRATETLSQDDAVTMGQVGKLLTIAQAADLLMVSSPYVVQLLDSGELESIRDGLDRRIPLDHLLDYRDQLALRRRASLQELTRLSEEMGLYDLDRNSED